MARCRKCGLVFANALQLGAHNRVCDPASTSSDRDYFSQSDNHSSDSDNTSASDTDVATLVVTQPAPLHTLARRSPRPWGRVVAAPLPQILPVNRDNLHNNIRARDYRELQTLWREHVAEVHKCCSSDFWKMFASLQGQTTSAKDRVLKLVKELLKQHYNPGHSWPTSCRGLRSRVEHKAGNFSALVTTTYTIDLAEYNLPGCARVQFHTLDPVYVWITQCNRLIEADIPVHFNPARLHHPDTGEEVFGAGMLWCIHVYVVYPVHVYVLVCSRIRAGVFTYTWCPPVHVYVLVCSRIRAFVFTYTWCILFTYTCWCVHVYVRMHSRIRGAHVFTYTCWCVHVYVLVCSRIRPVCSLKVLNTVRCYAKHVVQLVTRPDTSLCSILTGTVLWWDSALAVAPRSKFR